MGYWEDKQRYEESKQEDKPVKAKCPMNKDVEIIWRLIDGKFPDHEAIIPKTIDTEVLISRKELLGALKLANSFTSRIKDIKLKIKDKKII